MEDLHGERSEAATAGMHTLRQEDWDTEVLNPTTFQQRYRSGNPEQRGFIALLKLADADTYLASKNAVPPNGPVIAIATTAPIQGHKAHSTQECIVQKPNGECYLKKVHLFVLSSTAPNYKNNIPSFGASNTHQLEEIKLEVLDEAVAANPEWLTKPLDTARKFLNGLSADVASVRPAGERRITATVSLRKPLREMSGQSGVIVRPKAVTNEPVVWLPPTATLADAITFATKHAGRLIKSTKAFGIVTEREHITAAWTEIGKPEMATERHFVLTGMHYLTHPEALVGALSTNGIVCSVIAHQQAGTTQMVKIRTQQTLPQFFLFNNRNITTREVSTSHKLRRPKKKRPAAKPTTFVNNLANNTTAWSNVVRGSNSNAAPAPAAAAAPSATTATVDAASRAATSQNATNISSLRNDFAAKMSQMSDTQKNLNSQIHNNKGAIEELQRNVTELLTMQRDLQTGLQGLQASFNNLTSRLPGLIAEAIATKTRMPKDATEDGRDGRSERDGRDRRAPRTPPSAKKGRR